MDGSEVALAAIALAATAVGGVIWVVKYLANTLSLNIKENTKAAIKQRQSSESLIRSVDILSKQGDEHHKFMKNLNGKLASATIQTVKEQRVKHQTIESTD